MARRLWKYAGARGLTSATEDGETPTNAAGMASRQHMLSVIVKPGSKKPGFSMEGDSLVLRVRARAIEGAANAECLRAVAARFGVAPSSVELLRGIRGRRKLFRVTTTA